MLLIVLIPDNSDTEDETFDTRKTNLADRNNPEETNSGDFPDITMSPRVVPDAHHKIEMPNSFSETQNPKNDSEMIGQILIDPKLQEISSSSHSKKHHHKSKKKRNKKSQSSLKNEESDNKEEIIPTTARPRSLEAIISDMPAFPDSEYETSNNMQNETIKFENKDDNLGEYQEIESQETTLKDTGSGMNNTSFSKTQSELREPKQPEHSKYDYLGELVDPKSEMSQETNEQELLNEERLNFFQFLRKHPEEHFLYELWLIYYYINFVNGWLLLPIVICYFLSGHFSFKMRVVDSIKYNLKYYLVMLVVVAIVLVIILIQGNSFKQVFQISLSIYNTLFYMIFLVSMAHGLARLPAKYFKAPSVRSQYKTKANSFLSKMSKYSTRLKVLNEYRYILATFDELSIEQFEPEKRIIYSLLEQIKTIELNHDQRQKLKKSKLFKSFAGRKSNFVNLHALIIKDNYKLQMERAYVFENVKSLLRLNRLCHRLNGSPLAFNSAEYKELGSEEMAKRSWVFNCCPKLEGAYHRSIKKYLGWSLACVLAISSLGLLTVQIFGVVLQQDVYNTMASISSHVPGVFLIIYYIAYLSFCTYYFFFRFNLFGVVGIKRGNKSNVYALFYSSSMFVYLTYPICMNVFGLLVNSDNSCFQEALGKQEVAEIAGFSLFNLGPLVILLVVVLTCFNVLGRVLRKLGVGIDELQTSHLDISNLEVVENKLGAQVLEALEHFQEYRSCIDQSFQTLSLIE